MKIGQLAHQAEVSRDTVRFYERKGLLKGITRPHRHNNYKDYDERNVKRIQLIKKMKNLGLTLKECSEVLEAIESCDFETHFDAYQTEFIQRKIVELDKKIEELQHLRDMFLHFAQKTCKAQKDPRSLL